MAQSHVSKMVGDALVAEDTDDPWIALGPHQSSLEAPNGPETVALNAGLRHTRHENPVILETDLQGAFPSSDTAPRSSTTASRWPRTWLATGAECRCMPSHPSCVSWKSTTACSSGSIVTCRAARCSRETFLPSAPRPQRPREGILGPLPGPLAAAVHLVPWSRSPSRSTWPPCGRRTTPSRRRRPCPTPWTTPSAGAWQWTSTARGGRPTPGAMISWPGFEVADTSKACKEAATK